MKISFKNNNISISQEEINLDYASAFGNFIFIAQDFNSIQNFITNIGDFAYSYQDNTLYQYIGDNFGTPIFSSEIFNGFLPANFSDWSSTTRYYDTYGASNEFFRCGLNVGTGIHALERLSSTNNFLFESPSGLLGSIPSTFDLYLNIPSLFGASIRLIKNGTALSIPSQFSGVVTNISNTEVTFSNGDKITKDTLAVKTTATSTTGQIDWNSKVLWKDRALGFKENNGFIKMTSLSTLANPTIQANFSCTKFPDNSVQVNFNVEVNNSGRSSITVRASLNSNFSNSITTVANGGSTVSMSLTHNTSGSNPGQVTIYVRLEKSGFNNSSQVSRTETLNDCIIQL